MAVIETYSTLHCYRGVQTISRSEWKYRHDAVTHELIDKSLVPTNHRADA